MVTRKENSEFKPAILYTKTDLGFHSAYGRGVEKMNKYSPGHLYFFFNVSSETNEK